MLQTEMDQVLNESEGHEFEEYRPYKFELFENDQLKTVIPTPEVQSDGRRDVVISIRERINELQIRKRRGRSECDDTAGQVISGSSGSSNLSRYLQIKQSDEIGRYLVAAEDLLPGTVLLQEDPIIIGPNFGLGPTCLRCGQAIQSFGARNSSGSSLYDRCTNCEWPVCRDCTQGIDRINLHSTDECEILTKAAQKPREQVDGQLFNIITPMRALLTRKQDPGKWAEIQELESHNEIRKRNADQWRFYQTEVVDVIRKLGCFQEFTDDDLHTVCGYLQVNSFSVEHTNLRGLYPRVYLLAHSCVPNTAHVISSDHKLTLRATTPIKRGEMVTLSYADTFQGTTERRAYLKESKYFECKCERCKDPTELGTNFSSLRCQKCARGFQQQENPLEPKSPWICQNNRCRSTEKSTIVSIVTQTFREEIENARDKGIQFWEELLRKHEGLLHPNHYILTMAKCFLSQQYGKVPNYMIDELSLDQLQRKICLCQDVLKLSDVFEPGLSRLRGVTMYELHAPLLLHAVKNFQKGKSNKELFKRRLRAVVKYLEEAARILSFEDPSSAEGNILKAIETALKETKTWETQLKHI